MGQERQAGAIARSIRTTEITRNNFRLSMWTGTLFVLAIGLAAWLSVHTAAAQPAQGSGVAVVDVYAPSPGSAVGAVIAEELAADVLASLLTQDP